MPVECSGGFEAADARVPRRFRAGVCRRHPERFFRAGGDLPRGEFRRQASDEGGGSVPASVAARLRRPRRHHARVADGGRRGRDSRSAGTRRHGPGSGTRPRRTWSRRRGRAPTPNGLLPTRGPGRGAPAVARLTGRSGGGGNVGIGAGVTGGAGSASTRGSAPRPRRAPAAVPAPVPAARGRVGWGGSASRLGRRGREGLPQSPGHRSFDRRRSALHKLAELAELGENVLTRDVELLRELVYAGLACHWTP